MKEIYWLAYSAAAMCVATGCSAPARSESMDYGTLESMFGEPVTTSAMGDATARERSVGEHDDHHRGRHPACGHPPDTGRSSASTCRGSTSSRPATRALMLACAAISSLKCHACWCWWTGGRCLWTITRARSGTISR